MRACRRLYIESDRSFHNKPHTLAQCDRYWRVSFCPHDEFVKFTIGRISFNADKHPDFLVGLRHRLVDPEKSQEIDIAFDNAFDRIDENAAGGGVIDQCCRQAGSNGREQMFKRVNGSIATVEHGRQVRIDDNRTLTALPFPAGTVKVFDGRASVASIEPLSVGPKLKPGK